MVLLGSFDIITPDPGLFIWTVLVFLILVWILNKYAFGPIKVTPATSTSPARFSCIARPVNTKGRKRTGNDTFFIDETGIIRHSGSPTVWPDENSEPVR